MIEITITLIPHNIPGNTKHLGTIRIGNDGTGTPARGNYNVFFYDRNFRIFKTLKIKNWARKANSIWMLIKEIFKDTIDDQLEVDFPEMETNITEGVK